MSLAISFPLHSHLFSSHTIYYINPQSHDMLNKVKTGRTIAMCQCRTMSIERDWRMSARDIVDANQPYISLRQIALSSLSLVFLLPHVLYHHSHFHCSPIPNVYSWCCRYGSYCGSGSCERNNKNGSDNGRHGIFDLSCCVSLAVYTVLLSFSTFQLVSTHGPPDLRVSDGLGLFRLVPAGILVFNFLPVSRCG